MSLDEQVPQSAVTAEKPAESSSSTTTSEDIPLDQKTIEKERSEKLIQAKELYSNGSRNFLVKNYAQAADELSRVCSLYAELYGDLADELGMPSLLYAKSLIALSLDENKVIDVPDEAADDDDDDDDDNNDEQKENGEGEEEKNNEKATKEESEAISSNTNANKVVNGKSDTEKLETITEASEKTDEVDSTADEVVQPENASPAKTVPAVKDGEDALVTSTNNEKNINEENGPSSSKAGSSTAAKSNNIVKDDEKPSTSNGIVHDETEDVDAADEEENEAASNLQLAWEILETAANIFSRQGASGLPNLAEVQTELANIEFENCILDAARADYEKALKIYFALESHNYRRAMAEIHYKIGLTFLMQQLNKEGAASLKEACQLIQGEIDEIKSKENLSEKEKNTIQDMEETHQEIEAKILEIEEMQAQQMAEVRAALDNYIKPIMEHSAANNDAGPSTSAAAASSSSATSSSSSSSTALKPKPNDISHLIKRKKPEDVSSEAEAASPAKRSAH